MFIYHKHHIIPKHIGGTDDPSNIVRLTVTEHAEAHRILFENYGRWQDEIAWKGLSGIIGSEEAVSAAIRFGRIGKKHTEETKQKIRMRKLGKKSSEKTKKLLSEMRSGNKHWNYGRHQSVESKEKNRNSNIKRRKMNPELFSPPPSHKDVLHSEETKQKMRNARLLYWKRRKEVDRLQKV